jgi:hypothetical protein
MDDVCVLKCVAKGKGKVVPVLAEDVWGSGDIPKRNAITTQDGGGFIS